MKVSILGASGYAGGELLRLLSSHPEFEITGIFAANSAGEKITKVHPHLQNFGDKTFELFDAEKDAKCDLLFLALPHGESAKIIPTLPRDLPIVDLGADYRLEQPKHWSSYYSGEYAGTWPYGLPEISDREIYKTNRRIANPGWYATAIILGAAPMLKAPEIQSEDLVVVAASGTTGAGRSAKVNLLGSETMNNLTSYKFGGVHQHTPEIEEALTRISKKAIKVSFTPILAPMPRGILATLSFKIVREIENRTLRSYYSDFFSGKPFVKFLAEGEMPSTAAVLGTNYTHIQAAIDQHAGRVVVSVALDNLGKGAAGQAIQNANLLFGFSENLGLETLGTK